jgi:TonB family protein
MYSSFSTRSLNADLFARVTPRLLLAIIICALTASFSADAQQPAIRLAVLDAVGDERGEIAPALRSLAKNEISPAFDAVDEELVKLAARGVGYENSLNLSVSEARDLGRGIGCDYYILGKVLVTRRAVTQDQYYFEAVAGLFVVESMTGALRLFIFERVKSENEGEAYRELLSSVAGLWNRIKSSIIPAHTGREAEAGKIDLTATIPTEVFAGDLSGQGIEPPVFFQRLKPLYTEEADLAGIIATVEVEALFGADGKIGKAEVVRWAGFGLDESAIATIKQLHYKPAQRNGNNVTIRGLVRYNFRRPLAQAAKPQSASPAELDRIRRSLQGLLINRKQQVKPPD